MTCGCCVTCPQYSKDNDFIGATVRRRLPMSKNLKKKIRPLMQEGGISSCGNAQNCVCMLVGKTTSMPKKMFLNNYGVMRLT